MLQCVADCLRFGFDRSAVWIHIGSMMKHTVTVEDIARAIAHHFRSTRSDGSLTAIEYAFGIVNGRDSQIRWQDRMLAAERFATLPLAEIATAVIRYRAARVGQAGL